MSVMLAFSLMEDSDAFTLSPQKWPWPLWASEKVDGVRCASFLIKDGFYSRSGKPFPNRQLQSWWQPCFGGFDGELLVNGSFKETVSYVMSPDRVLERPSEVVWWIFDNFEDRGLPYKERYKRVLGGEYTWGIFKVRALPQYQLESFEDYTHFEEKVEKIFPYEGTILRRPNAPYKFGRSTPSEFYLAKVKKPTFLECKVLGYKPLFHNLNDPFIENGYTKRPKIAEGLVQSDLLGALHVESGGVDFWVGTGFTTQQRESLWRLRDILVGKRLVVKHWGKTLQGVPRHPTFERFAPNECWERNQKP